jgi:uncharacterized protein YutE (UPF0331/DUF86 family)
VGGGGAGRLIAVEVMDRKLYADDADGADFLYNRLVHNGVIAQKLQALDRTLVELRSLGVVTLDQLKTNWQTHRAIERNLQVLVEIVIDVCQRLIALEGQSPATTGGDAIGRCIDLGVLSNDENYTNMVRLRNFIVHRYEHVDPAVLVGMMNKHLSDFEKFRDEVTRYVQAH